ncbi:uncharacterized protein LOC131647732 [Vicia villosa]|uniref:uncharacterized protein LOC131647732 n=1 Tax=Vicia villosa TaxID=3911 RepID=UPI00273B9024|nr:uncharacterized protein LOC131647732 [Vicia villosa]
MKKAGEDNPKIWPTHLDAMLNRQMVFRIKYQSQFCRFSIVKILNEEGLYDKFDTYLKANEATIAADLEVDTASPSLTPNQGTQNMEPSIVALPDEGNNQKGSPSASCGSTPAKRVAASTSFNELIQAEVITPKQSATKPKNGKKTKQLKHD